MDGRARKRSVPGEEVRQDDKRACSTAGIRPGVSSSGEPEGPPTPAAPSSSDHRFDDQVMESSSFSSVLPESYSLDRDEGEDESSCSDGGDDDDDEPDPDPDRRDGSYGCSMSKEKIKSVLTSLGDDAGTGAQLEALAELCEMLSFGSEDSLDSLVADSFASALVRLAGPDSNPEIMLLAIRALAYLCDVLPWSATTIVSHGALPVLCERLLSIEYLDVAEQGVQALEKISHHQPLPCLRAGAIMAVLVYIDFFTTSIQRVALSTVANVCKKFPSDCSSLVLEAVPTLCNLLHYDDVKIVETAAVCLNRISENLNSSTDLLDDMCKHDLINKCASVIASASGGRPSVIQETHIELIRLLSRLAYGSLIAFKTLLELNISCTLRGILENADISPNASHSFRGNGHVNQVHEVLKFLMQLLPSGATGDKDIQLVLAKEKILAQEEPKFLNQLGKDVLPILVQVVNSGASPTICYDCISLIHSMVYLSSSDMLLDLFRNINFSSFLAGVLSRKDIHVLNSALKTVQILLERHTDDFMGPFIKEGVVYAIDSLQITENHAPVMAQSGHAPLADSGRVTVKDNTSKCFCHAFNPYFSLSPQARTCKLEKDVVLTLAKEIRSTYFNTVSRDSEMGMTTTLQKLKSLCRSLNDDVEKSRIMGYKTEEYLAHIVRQILEELNAGEPMSTFEFIESGIVRSLAYYLSNGLYFQDQDIVTDLDDHFSIILKRFQTFAGICLSRLGQKHGTVLLTLLVQKLQNALASYDQFPVVLSLGYKNRNVYADIPFGRITMHPCLKVRFVPEDESVSNDYSEKVLVIESSSSLDAIEDFLWPKISTKHGEETAEKGKKDSVLGEDYAEGRVPCDKHGKDIDESQSLASSLLEVTINQESHLSPAADASMSDVELMTRNATFLGVTSRKRTRSTSHLSGYASPKLHFYLEGKQLDRSLSLYQAILQQHLNAEPDMVIGPKFWNDVHKVAYKMTKSESKCRPSPRSSDFPWHRMLLSWPNLPSFSCILDAVLPCTLEKTKHVCDMLFMLKALEGLSQVGYKLLSHERINAFAEGRIVEFHGLKIVSEIPRLEFSSSKLTEKLEQQMRDPLSSVTGCMPPWCSQLMASCPFLFSFEARWKYVCLIALSSSRVQQKPSSRWNNGSNTNNLVDSQRSHAGNFARKRFQVDRNHVLESAAKIMSSHAHKEATLDVEFSEEVGIGLGPTLEFYTLVSHEFQKIGLGMWRGDNNSITSMQVGVSGYVIAPLGLFPHPWSPDTISLRGIQFTDVEQQFVLLGQIVAKALQDGRVLDLPFSKAFYKLMLEQELDVYDIQSFDPGLGTTLLEFQALVCRKRFLESTSGKDAGIESNLYYRGTRVKDLCLDFSLPGHSDYLLACENNSDMVNINNLEEYVSLIVDATIGSGISRQIEAFKSGFNEVFSLKALQFFTEDELERLLCGEQNSWMFDEVLDHVRFDHGYTAISPPVISLLETIREFDCDQRRAFLQFVTGAPRLPPGGFAALNPKLTVVRKHCSDCTDMELPSVMTCANYLKLPAYSSKEKLRERLLYAITEGQGSFHLS